MSGATPPTTLKSGIITGGKRYVGWRITLAHDAAHTDGYFVFLEGDGNEYDEWYLERADAEGMIADNYLVEWDGSAVHLTRM